MCTPFAALCSDESSRTQSTNCETLSHKISEIKQSTLVITQVLTFITVELRMGFLPRIKFKLLQGVIAPQH